ncbi:uncharacterized protein CTRU02_201183 [Colletotrichum truncatum]|uniref:Uncharacterized protein n=1 Tax=Colletotrichum truncatum TaxID=5467 RepID=A0ACC3ZH92_COLTU|nr:uncharacterized protein CTRU02_07969 [Colletotrichum truncatum]KAF6790449.1 hypothetical protein CTRU02_07969 [Colletotrichum truncatum]
MYGIYLGIGQPTRLVEQSAPRQNNQHCFLYILRNTSFLLFVILIGLP